MRPKINRTMTVIQAKMDSIKRKLPYLKAMVR
jgi:hypothetical protein